MTQTKWRSTNQDDRHDCECNLKSSNGNGNKEQKFLGFACRKCIQDQIEDGTKIQNEQKHKLNKIQHRPRQTSCLRHANRTAATSVGFSKRHVCDRRSRHHATFEAKLVRPSHDEATDFDSTINAHPRFTLPKDSLAFVRVEPLRFTTDFRSLGLVR